MLSHEEIEARLLARPGVQEAFDELAPHDRFCERLLQARQALGLTQKQLAERVGTNKSSVSRWESPRLGTLPSGSTLMKLAEALDCELDIRFVPRKGRKTRAG